MMIYLASYKGRDKGARGAVDALIRSVTKSTYSHTELCVGNPFERPVLCVSSTGEHGVRATVQSLPAADYDLVPLPFVSQQDVDKFVRANHAAGYDYVGTVRSVLPFLLREHPTQFFCSEVAATIMGLRDPWRFPPGGLHAVAQTLSERLPAAGGPPTTQSPP